MQLFLIEITLLSLAEQALNVLKRVADVRKRKCLRKILLDSIVIIYQDNVHMLKD